MVGKCPAGIVAAEKHRIGPIEIPSSGARTQSMSRILISGGTGFLGHYLARELKGRGHQVTATFLDPPPFRLPAVPGVDYIPLDVTDPGSVGRTIAELEPEAVYHLAGQAYVQESLVHPE